MRTASTEIKHATLVALPSIHIIKEKYIAAWACELYAVKWWCHLTFVSLTIAM